MGYSSNTGKRPFEMASKASHSYIINDPVVQAFLNRIEVPSSKDEIEVDYCPCGILQEGNNPINYFIAVDGGYSTTMVKKSFPSAEIAFCQYGANIFSKEDLEGLSPMPFIGPEDINKLKQIERHKVVLPIKNVTVKNSKSLKNSLRETIFEHFMIDDEGECFAETLKWFIYEEYREIPIPEYQLANCPVCGKVKVILRHADINKFKFKCDSCRGDIFLTDVFRFHEIVDEELGAAGFLGYFINLMEHFVIIHLIRLILKRKSSLLNEIMFIKDGPLAFFGQTANMHKKMRNLTIFLHDNFNLFLVGVEKSGIFVEHANEIAEMLNPNSVMLINNDYIYKHIIKGFPDLQNPFACTSYYSGKFIYKSEDKKIFVATLPTRDAKIVLSPSKKDFHNIDIIIANLQKLSCDMYDNSLVPIALVNKLVSLSIHPSKIILERFAKDNIFKQ